MNARKLSLRISIYIFFIFEFLFKAGGIFPESVIILWYMGSEKLNLLKAKVKHSLALSKTLWRMTFLEILEILIGSTFLILLFYN